MSLELTSESLERGMDKSRPPGTRSANVKLASVRIGSEINGAGFVGVQQH